MVSSSRRFAPLALVAALLFGALLYSPPVSAQYRNNGVIMPSIGYFSGHESLDIFTGLAAENIGPLDDVGFGDWEWNTTGHLTIGAGYMRALGYNLWLIVETAIGGGVATKYVGSPLPPPVFSLHVSTGLRYNFLDEEYRPFISGHVHYLHQFSTPAAQLRINNIQGLTDSGAGRTAASFFVGMRAGGGFEWFFLSSLRRWGLDVPIFYDEMSLQAEANAAMFLLLGAPLPSFVARASYIVYF